MVSQICEDLETVGMKSERIIVKSDQEPAVADVAREVAKIRSAEHGTAIDNSSVGDSNSNGTIERTIQDVEGMCRTLRLALLQRIKTNVKMKSTIVR